MLCCFLTAVLRVNETGGLSGLSLERAKGAEGQRTEGAMATGGKRRVFLELGVERARLEYIVCMYLWLS